MSAQQEQREQSTGRQSEGEATLRAETAEDQVETAGPQQRSGALSRRIARADLPAVGEVRHALRELLSGWERSPGSDVAELLTSELVTNALVHTDYEVLFTATVSARRLRVEVRDFAARRPSPWLPSVDDGTHGRGLILVQCLADGWGVITQGAGKVVWFELDGVAA
jgi:anti-sigma regulatory factor (Ser/Thr protein kinase)